MLALRLVAPRRGAALATTACRLPLAAVSTRTLTTNKPVDELILNDHREIFALWHDFQSTLPTNNPNTQTQGTTHQDLASRHSGGSTSAQASTLSYGGGPQFTTGEDNTRPVDVDFGSTMRGSKNKQRPEQESSEGASIASVQERTKIANSLLRAIVIHSVAEEVVVYPELRAIRGDAIVDKLLAEQQEVENELYELDKMPVTHPDYVPRLAKIMKHLELHTRDEERVEMPELRARLNDEWLNSLGTRFMAVKLMVPTRPHPSAPTQPTLEALVGMMTAPLDYLRDRMSGREFVKPSKNAMKAEEGRHA